MPAVQLDAAAFVGRCVAALLAQVQRELVRQARADRDQRAVPTRRLCAVQVAGSAGYHAARAGAV